MTVDSRIIHPSLCSLCQLKVVSLRDIPTCNSGKERRCGLTGSIHANAFADSKNKCIYSHVVAYSEFALDLIFIFLECGKTPTQKNRGKEDVCAERSRQGTDHKSLNSDLWFWRNQSGSCFLFMSFFFFYKIDGWIDLTTLHFKFNTVGTLTFQPSLVFLLI